KTSTKCNTLSDQFRKQGNELFVKGKWSQSLEHFTKALCVAENQSEPYSLALANRSAALYSLSYYQYSLSDINRCLRNYPDKLKYKVYVRKINCYHKIGFADEAKATFKEAVDFVNGNRKFTEEEKEYYIKKLQDTE
ncbi:Tetratricopeptide repeat-containing protein, partial [Oryctes borbonicus]